MTIKRNGLKSIILYIFLFYLIYTPTISSSIFFDKNVVICILGLGILVINIGKESFKKEFLTKDNMKYAGLIFLSMLYYLAIYAFNNSNMTLIDSRILQNSLPIWILISIAIIMKMTAGYENQKEYLINVLIDLATLQGIICVLMVIIPGLKSVALYLYYLGREENIYITSMRIFGISSDYTYSTPIYHGFLAALCFNKVISGERKRFINMFFILIAVLLNGRTGILIFTCCCFIYAIYQIVIRGKLIRAFVLLFLTIISFSILMLLLSIFAVKTYNFVNSFIKDTVMLITERDLSGNYKYLDASFYFPKKNINVIIGEGHRVYSKEARKWGCKASDIGYVNDIFMGGMIYSLLLYMAYIVFALKKMKYMNGNEKIVSLCLILTMFIANYKGEAFRASILIFLFLFYNLAFKPIKKQEENA